METFLQGKKIDQFSAIQNCLVPRSEKFEPTQKKESIRLVNEFISTKPKKVAAKIALFLFVIDLFSVFRFGAVFRKLPRKKQTHIMDILFNHPIPLLRKGFWGINTLAKLGAFGQSSVYSDIGYTKGQV